MIMAKKFSTYFLLLLMICSLTLFVGCGKDDDKDKDKGKDQDVVENQENKDNDDNNEEEVANNDNKPSQEKEEEKKVVLLKRNGVEWKENTSINSQKGAQKYTVVWGDTLSLIARTWNVNTYTLAKYNGIENIDLIEVGQVIYNYTYKG